jgi:hypothetical protein
VRTSLVGNNDEELAKELLYSDIYGSDHPYGSLNMGNSGDLESLTLDDVKTFYASHYTIRNITVGISGGYPASFAARLSADLQALPAGSPAQFELPTTEIIDSNRAIIVEKENLRSLCRSASRSISSGVIRTGLPCGWPVLIWVNTGVRTGSCIREYEVNAG